MDTFLKNCTIVDGSGATPYESGILISGRKIKKITTSVPDDFTGQVIPCDGLVVTPGFIDGHSHNDWFALSKDQNLYFDPFVLQGITTFVSGNCGFSVSGYSPYCACKNHIGAGLFKLDEESEDFHSHARWFDGVDRKCHVNMASLAGHGTARIGVNGLKNTPLSPENRARMLEDLEASLQAGAAGVSLGLMYEPGIYAPYDELVDVARLCVKYDKVLAVHARAYSTISLSYRSVGRSHMLLALDEMDRLVRETGVRLQYSHLIFVGRRTWKDEKAAVKILAALKQDGYDVSFDMFPLHYGPSIITVILPDWYQAMSKQERRKKFNYLRLAVMVRLSARLLGFNFSDIRVSYAGEEQLDVIGKTIEQIARERGISSLDAYLDVCEKSDFKASVLMGGYQNDAIISRLMGNDQSIFMTDAWVEKQGKQNGAIFGAFPLFIEKARDMGWPIEKVIFKMTGMTAQRFKIPERGFIRENYYADLNVIDLQQLAHRIESDLPPLGLRYTFINGRLEAKDGQRVENQGSAGMAIRV